MFRTLANVDSPAIADAKARADATDYVKQYGPDLTLWTHLLDWKVATAADYSVALELIERTNPAAIRFIDHLRTMRDINAQRDDYRHVGLNV